MAENRIQALLEIALTLPKREQDRLQRQLQGLLSTALPKSLKNDPMGELFENRREAIAATTAEIKRLNQLISATPKGEAERIANLKQQRGLIERLRQIEDTRVDVQIEEIQRGKQIADQIKARKADYRRLNAEQRRSLEIYRAVAEARQTQIQSVVTQAKRLSGTGGERPLLLTGYTSEAKAIKEELSLIGDLTNIKKLEAAETRASAKAKTDSARASKNQAAADRESARAARDNAKAQSQAEEARAARARRQAGANALIKSGGLSGVTTLSGRDLDLALESIQASKESYQRRLRSIEAAGGIGTENYNATIRRLEDYNRAIAEGTRRIQEREAAVKRTASAEKTAATEAAQARIREGQRIVTAAGGPTGISSIDSKDLQLAKEFLRAKQAELQVEQSQLLSNANASSGAIARNKRDLQEYGEAIASVNRELRASNGLLRETGLFIRQFARLGLAFSAAFAVVDGVRATIASIIELNKQLISLQAISGATNREMRSIGAAIKRTAQDTKYSVTEVADAAQTLAQAGVSNADIPAALQATAQFAAGTNSSIEITADLLTTVKDVYKELDFQSIANILTRTANLSKITADDLKTILSLSASTANQFDISANQYLSAVSVLRNAGLKASTTATGLRQVMMQIFTPNDKTLKILQKRYKEIGEDLTRAEIRGRLFEYTQSKEPLIAALSELQRLGYNAGPGRSLLQTGFDIRTRNALSVLVANIDQLRQFSPEIQIGNAAMAASQKQMESLANSAENLGGAISVLANDIAGNGPGTLATGVRSLTDLVDELDKYNNRLRASVGEGIGPSLAGGAISSLIGYATGRGSVPSRVGQGLITGIGGAALGTQLNSPGLSSTVNSLISLLAGPLSALLVSSFSQAAEAVEARRGAGVSVGRYSTTVTGATTAAQAARASQVVGDAATAGLLATSLGKFFSSIGRFAVGLLGPVGTAVAAVAKLAPAGGLIARGVGLVARFINPAVGVLLTIASVAGALKLIGKEDRSEDLIERLRQANSNIDAEIAARAAELNELAQIDVSDKAPEQSAGRALRDLQGKIRDVEAYQQQFFGGTIENLEQVRGLFADLASGDASVFGSEFRKAAIQQLADQIRVVDSSGQPIDITSTALENTQEDLQAFANSVAGLVDQTDGLQSGVAQMIRTVQSVKPDMLNSFQAALLAATRSLSDYDYAIVTGEIQVNPDELATKISTLFNDVREAANRKIQGEYSTPADALTAKIEETVSKLTGTESLTREQAEEAIGMLIQSARDLGVSTTGVLQTLAGKLDEAERGLAAEEAKMRSRSPLLGRYMGGLGSARPDPSADDALVPLRRRILTTERASSTAQRQIEKINAGNAESRRNAERVSAQYLNALPGMLKEYDADRAKNPFKYSTSEQTAAENVRKLLGVDPKSTIQTNVQGVSSVSPALEAARGVLQKAADTGPAATRNEPEKKPREQRFTPEPYEERDDLQRLQIEAERRLRAQQLAGSAYEDQLSTLRSKQRAEMEQIVDQLAYENGNLEQVRGNQRDELAVTRRINALKNKQFELQGRQNEEIDALIQSTHQQAVQNEQILNQQAQDAGDLAAFMASSRRERAEFNTYLERIASQMREAVNDDGTATFTDKQIQARLDRERANDRPISANPSALLNTLNNNQGGQFLSRYGTSGFSTGDALEDARRAQQGLLATSQEQYELDQRRLPIIQERINALIAERDSQARSNAELEAYNQAIRDQQGLIGDLQGEMADIDGNFMAQISKGFSIDRLVGTLDNAEGSLRNLGNTLGSNLASGIDGFSQSMADASLNAKGFKKSVSATFKSLADNIIRQLTRILIQQLIMKAITGAAGAFAGGGGGASGQAGLAAMGLGEYSYTGQPSYAKGVASIRGPGTPTSDSIPVRVSRGESILTAKATDLLGDDFINKINGGMLPRYATGGIIGNNRNNATTQYQGPRSGDLTVEVVNETQTPAKGTAKKQTGPDGRELLRIFLKEAAADVRRGGELGQAVTQTTTAGRRLSG